MFVRLSVCLIFGFLSVVFVCLSLMSNGVYMSDYLYASSCLSHFLYLYVSLIIIFVMNNEGISNNDESNINNGYGINSYDVNSNNGK